MEMKQNIPPRLRRKGGQEESEKRNKRRGVRLTLRIHDSTAGWRKHEWQEGHKSMIA